MWLPQEESLRQVVQVFGDALRARDAVSQKNATLALVQLKASPDIDRYYAYLLANPQCPPALQGNAKDFQTARQSAALQLKNDVKDNYRSKSKDQISYIKSSSLAALRDDDPMIRKFAGSVITEVVHQGTIHVWPELFEELFSLVGNQSGATSTATQEAAMNAIAKICEDNEKLLLGDNNQSPLDFLAPKLLETTRSPHSKVRADALASLVIFIPHMSPAVLSVLDPLLLRISELAEDPSVDVRKYVCRAFLNIAEIDPLKIKPHISSITNYMLSQQRDSDNPELALDAAEFWLASAENKELRTLVAPSLPKIIPVLLESMIYSAEEIALLECADGDDDADQEDRAEDIKPAFAKKKGARQAKGTAEPGAKKSGETNGASDYADDEELSDGEIGEDEEEDDDDGQGGDPEDAWNLRKCSAAALDEFSTHYPDEAFAIVLPYLIQNLKHSNWPSREAAVLALGAIAEGCMKSVIPHLAELVPYLLTLLNDSEPVVRKITCWTLSRYSAWAAHLTDPQQITNFFEPMMDGILKKMLDRNKKVQEAAVSAFAVLEEQAGNQLLAYAVPIARQFVQCFSKYKDRNMALLYDCVQSFAESLGPSLARPDILEILMPAVLTRWAKVSNQSQEIFHLMECVACIAESLKNAFDPFAEVTFKKCISVMYQSIENYLAASKNPALEQPDKDFLVASLDTLATVIEVCSTSLVASLAANSNPNFFQLLVFCLEDPAPSVRQSAYALLGDSAKSLSPLLQPILPTILPILTKQLDLDRVNEDDPESELTVINNACWSLGEICLRSEQDLKEWVVELSSRLTAIASDHSIEDSVSQNAAISIGRLGLSYSTLLAPHLTQLAEPFLESMQDISFTDEKDQAYHGFSLVVFQNPQAMEKSLGLYFKAISVYLSYARGPNPRIYAKETVIPLFGQIIEGYKGIIPDFDSFIDHLEPSVSSVFKQELSR